MQETDAGKSSTQMSSGVCSIFAKETKEIFIPGFSNIGTATVGEV